MPVHEQLERPASAREQRQSQHIRTAGIAIVAVTDDSYTAACRAEVLRATCAARQAGTYPDCVTSGWLRHLGALPPEPANPLQSEAETL